MSEFQPLSFFTKNIDTVSHIRWLNDESKRLDSHFTDARELGEELADIGRVRNFSNYSNFLARNNNSLDAVRLIQEDIGNTMKRITAFIDHVVACGFLNYPGENVGNAKHYNTTDGYSFAKGQDENGKDWYEFKAPNFELYKYWKQAKFDHSIGIEPGRWTDNSLVHTIDLRDPLVAPEASYSQRFKYQIGNMGTDRCTKLLQIKESDISSQPSLDAVEKDHNRKFSTQLLIMDGDFYKK